MNKIELRRKHLKLRDTLAADELEEKSLAIHRRLLQTDCYKNAKTIMVYLSFKSEVKTDNIVKQAIMDDKRVLVPVCNQSDNTITPCVLSEGSKLKKGSYGILEPENKYIAGIGEIDLVILPGVAFDKAGNRIGYGKGYYDRFLSAVSKRCRTVGLAFDMNVEESIPKGEHDIPIHAVITEYGIFGADYAKD